MRPCVICKEDAYSPSRHYEGIGENGIRIVCERLFGAPTLAPEDVCVFCAYASLFGSPQQLYLIDRQGTPDFLARSLEYRVAAVNKSLAR